MMPQKISSIRLPASIPLPNLTTASTIKTTPPTTPTTLPATATTTTTTTATTTTTTTTTQPAATATTETPDHRISSQLPSPPVFLDERDGLSLYPSSKVMSQPNPSFVLDDKNPLTEEPESLTLLPPHSKRPADVDDDLTVGLQRPSKRRSTDSASASTSDPGAMFTSSEASTRSSSMSTAPSTTSSSSTKARVTTTLKQGGPEALWSNVTMTSIDMKYLNQYVLAGEDLNVANSSSHGLLYLAVKNKSLEALRLFLQTSNIEINALNGNAKEVPLHVAAQLDFVEAIELLVDTGAWVNAPNKLGNTPLYEAIYSKSLGAAQLLLASGADPTVCDPAGNTLLHIAVSQNHSESLKLLLSDSRCAALVNTHNLAIMTPLANSITLAHSECMHELIHQGAVIQSRLRHGKTLLHYAVHWNRMEALETLISTGCDPNICNDADETPLYLATQQAKIDMVQYLVAKGADPCYPTSGTTAANNPLLYAAAHGYFEMCALLVTDNTPERVIFMALQMASRGNGVGNETIGVLYRALMGRKEREKRRREREERERERPMDFPAITVAPSPHVAVAPSTMAVTLTASATDGTALVPFMMSDAVKVKAVEDEGEKEEIEGGVDSDMVLFADENESTIEGFLDGNGEAQGAAGGTQCVEMDVIELEPTEGVNLGN